MNADMDAKKLTLVPEDTLTADTVSYPSEEEMELFQHATTMMIDRGDNDWMGNGIQKAA
ncbi:MULTISPECIES: hypothetical protein [Pseudomonas]|uniref:Uncharacterized protein n=4 Tax=Pseudomonas TaxID=286 RepID=A0A0P9LWI6_9PSED|nr:MULTISPECIES: hypothetical protein [Pseudomonas]MCW6054598.1 hypothetical protein [Pseudomonas fragi]MEE4084797.1 hypothetical protein [Pseudomonas viridiflava]KPW82813.1 Unknown protein sequence [Pseudomonas congelans]MBD8567907.1 hypothetical protein [Pseudomonas syringae]MBP1086759.1 hypothetical protein [Pseudomonas sp. PvP007]